MSRSKSQRRFLDWIKSKRRKKLVNSLYGDTGKAFGYYSNNSIANKFCTPKRTKRYKTRKAHVIYDHHGGYGEAINPNANHRKQIEDMDLQTDEYLNGGD